MNEYDLVVSKLFRGTGVDFEDCLMLVKARKGKMDIKRLERHFRETAGYDISEGRITRHLERFISILKDEKLYG
ncbi:MAG: hypothetical protein AB1724_18185 [Thermodesulfobacteriota bacterium]